MLLAAGIICCVCIVVVKLLPKYSPATNLFCVESYTRVLLFAAVKSTSSKPRRRTSPPPPLPPPLSDAIASRVTCALICCLKPERSSFSLSSKGFKSEGLPSRPAGPIGPAGPCVPVSPLGPIRPRSPRLPCGPCSPLSPTGPCIPAGPCIPSLPFGPLSPCSTIISFGFSPSSVTKLIFFRDLRISLLASSRAALSNFAFSSSFIEFIPRNRLCLDFLVDYSFSQLVFDPLHSFLQVQSFLPVRLVRYRLRYHRHSLGCLHQTLLF